MALDPEQAYGGSVVLSNGPVEGSPWQKQAFSSSRPDGVLSLSVFGPSFVPITRGALRDLPSVDDLEDAVEHAERVSCAAPLLALRVVVVNVSVGKHLRGRHHVWDRRLLSSAKRPRASPSTYKCKQP